MQQNGGTVTLRLVPPDLGTVRVVMEIRNGMANVQFQTEHESAQTLLSNQLDSLRGALESHGLSVGKLEVQVLPRQAAAANQGGSATPAYDEGRSRGQYTGDSGTQRDRGRENASTSTSRTAPSFAQALVNVVA